ncbi:MAG: 4'-phosphopantetheinyl transferase superfamily protein [Rikenellaceae bacterium]
MNNHQLIIEPILPLDTLRTMVTPSEWHQAQEFTSLSRQREWLSWRAHLRAQWRSDIEIAYTEQGAPYIVGSDTHISVSHTRTHIAIILSDTPCAIDMEQLSRNFAKVAKRYISGAESHIITTPLHQAIAWCTKEAAYKYATRSCDFLSDICIKRMSGGEILVEIRGINIVAHYIVNEEFVVVYIK